MWGYEGGSWASYVCHHPTVHPALFTQLVSHDHPGDFSFCCRSLVAAYDLVSRGTASNVNVMAGGFYGWVKAGG